MSVGKHKNYDTLNLIGYGLAKFDAAFVKLMGFSSKQAFFKHVVDIKVAETVGVVKNRQDLFDPFFDTPRRGWWQKGEAYIHRKKLIDSLFGELNAEEYADIVRFHLQTEFAGQDVKIEPILQSKFRQIQQTGQEAEMYFMHHYAEIESFKDGTLQDARLLGDGYDFQIQVDFRYYLAEVKGVGTESGNIRMTHKEFNKAKEYKNDFALAVVSNLYDLPTMNIVFDPLRKIELTEKEITSTQLSYHSKNINWQKTFHKPSS